MIIARNITAPFIGKSCKDEVDRIVANRVGQLCRQDRIEILTDERNAALDQIAVMIRERIQLEDTLSRDRLVFGVSLTLLLGWAAIATVYLIWPSA